VLCEEEMGLVNKMLQYVQILKCNAILEEVDDVCPGLMCYSFNFLTYIDVYLFYHLSYVPL
jgi:hypothetical protein